mmetsp:Transcript_41508/g.117556  ORF Transcript_41508/g.117556 Transcript_41508/m.117556 type:complete len:224 (+) Transcript_41508:948-1619(+)
MSWPPSPALKTGPQWSGWPSSAIAGAGRGWRLATRRLTTMAPTPRAAVRIGRTPRTPRASPPCSASLQPTATRSRRWTSCSPRRRTPPSSWMHQQAWNLQRSRRLHQAGRAQPGNRVLAAWLPRRCPLRPLPPPRQRRLLRGPLVRGPMSTSAVAARRRVPRGGRLRRCEQRHCPTTFGTPQPRHVRRRGRARMPCRPPVAAPRLRGLRPALMATASEPREPW